MALDYSNANANKKTTYFVVDGAEEMLTDDPSGKPYGPECSFVKALKGIYETCVRYCVTDEALRHMVGVLVINTKNTENDPDIAMGAENMKHIFPIGYLDKEKVLILEDFIKSDDLKSLFMEWFGGHARSSYQKMASYCKLNISYSGTSKRFSSWIHLTNNANPFKKNFRLDDEYKKMLRNLHDIEGRKAADMDGKLKPLKGRCTVIFLNSECVEGSDKERLLDMWKTVDDQVDVYSDSNDLGKRLLHRSGNVRAFSVIPFSLGPGVEFNVSVYSLGAVKLKPTPVRVHGHTGAAVKTVTMYKADMEIDDEEAKAEPVKGALFQDGELARRELSHVKKVGGETIVLSKAEVDTMHQFPKGMRLIEFRPIEEIDVFEHVRAPWQIRPHEQTHNGATPLYSALFERMLARGVAAICEYSARSNQRPRHVALIPNDVNNPKEGLHRGFLVVELHDTDDKLDIAAALEEKLQAPDGELWPQASRAAANAAETLCSELRNDDFVCTQIRNPHLQAFYAMLCNEANVSAPDPDPDSDEWEEAMLNQWDKTRAWFDCDEPSTSAEASAGAFAEECNIAGWNPETAKSVSAKRKTEANGASSARAPSQKKARNDEAIDLKNYANSGKLPSLTVAQLRGLCGSEGIDLKSSAKKKDDIIAVINKYYGT